MDSELLPLVAIQPSPVYDDPTIRLGSEIDVSEKHLEVKGSKSETRQKRLVILQPPLINLLKR